MATENKDHKKILLDQLSISYTKNTFNIDSEVIDYIEKHNDDDSISTPEYINLVLCDTYGITDKKIEILVDFFKIKLSSEHLDQFQSLICYAQIERMDKIDDLTNFILGKHFGKIQMRRLNILLKPHFEEVKGKILSVFSEDLKGKVEKIKRGEI